MMQYMYDFVGIYRVYEAAQRTADTRLNEYITGLSIEDIRIIECAQYIGYHYIIEGSVSIEADTQDAADKRFKERTKGMDIMIKRRIPV